MPESEAPARRRFRHEVASTLLSRVLLLSANLVGAVAAARLLGPAGRGDLAVALLIPAVLTLLLGFGASAAATYVVGRGDDPKQVVANSLGWTCAGGCLGLGLMSLLLLTGSARWVTPSLTATEVLLATLPLPLLMLQAQWSGVLRGMQAVGPANAVDVVQAVAVAASTWVALAADPRVSVALLAYSGALVCGLLLTWLLLRRRQVVVTLGWYPEVARRSVSFGLRGDIANVLQFFNYRLDLFLVAGILGSAEAGQYTVAGRVAELLWLMPTAVSLVLFPRLARGYEESARLTARVFWATVSLTGLAGGTLALLGRPLLSWLFSDQYLPAFPALVVLVPGVVLVGASAVLSSEVAARGRPGLNSLNSLAALVFTVVLDVLLIPRWGIVGAGVASTVAYALNFVLASLLYVRVTTVGMKDLLSAWRWWTASQS